MHPEMNMHNPLTSGSGIDPMIEWFYRHKHAPEVKEDHLDLYSHQETITLKFYIYIYKAFSILNHKFYYLVIILVIYLFWSSKRSFDIYKTGRIFRQLHNIDCGGIVEQSASLHAS